MATTRSTRLRDRWNQMSCAEKTEMVQEEIKRVSRLPSNSTHAIHRLRVLNKLLELLSLQKTSSHEELELLFAQLSL